MVERHEQMFASSPDGMIRAGSATQAGGASEAVVPRGGLQLVRRPDFPERRAHTRAFFGRDEVNRRVRAGTPHGEFEDRLAFPGEQRFVRGHPAKRRRLRPPEAAVLLRDQSAT
jgi:hypothetical protein